MEKLHSAYFNHVASHNFDFNERHIIYQRVEPKDVGIASNAVVHHIKEEDYDSILERHNINPNNQEADDYTHGWNAPHYWKHHCVNHLVALENSDADYIVMADADCHMLDMTNWVEKGIKLLKDDKSILVVSPNDGTSSRKTMTMSQQLFLCHRERMLSIDFDLPFKGFKDGGPMQEYYWMLEGRIGRYMENNGLFRFILPEQYRYWHKQF